MTEILMIVSECKLIKLKKKDNGKIIIFRFSYKNDFKKTIKITSY